MTALCEQRPASRPWACPDARLVLRADACRDEWLAARSGGIGSSDASAVLGLNRWTSPYEVWAEKLGLIPAQPDNDHLELGRLLEPVIADRWVRQSGIPVRKAGLMASRQRPWQLASVDRLAECGGLVEIKTLSFRVAEEWEDGQTPDHAEVQVQHQMAVTGRDHAHVVGLQDGRTWLERVVERDDPLIEDLTAIEHEFWHEHVIARVEPPVDGSTAMTGVLNARWSALIDVEAPLGDDARQLLEQRAAACRAVEEAEAVKAAAENKLRALLGETTVGVLPGVDKPLTWRRNGTFAAKRFVADHPEVAAEVTRPRPALDVDLLKRTHPDLYAAYRARVLRVPQL